MLTYAGDHRVMFEAKFLSDISTQTAVVVISNQTRDHHHGAVHGAVVAASEAIADLSQVGSP